MKKTVLISLVLCMYVLLCGCPYSTITPDSNPILPPDPTINPTIYNGLIGEKYNGGVDVNILFGIKNRDNSYSITIAPTIPGIPSGPMTFARCYFSTVPVIDDPKTVIIEIIDNANNHYFSVLDTTCSASLPPKVIGVNLLTLPATFTDFLKFEKLPTINAQSISDYLNMLKGGIVPTSTDGGYDKDTEIKSVNFKGFSSTGSSSSGGTTIINNYIQPPSTGMIAFSKKRLLVLIAGLLFMGALGAVLIIRLAKDKK